MCNHVLVRRCFTALSVASLNVPHTRFLSLLICALHVGIEAGHPCWRKVRWSSNCCILQIRGRNSRANTTILSTEKMQRLHSGMVCARRQHVSWTYHGATIKIRDVETLGHEMKYVGARVKDGAKSDSAATVFKTVTRWILSVTPHSVPTNDSGQIPATSVRLQSNLVQECCECTAPDDQMVCTSVTHQHDRR